MLAQYRLETVKPLFSPCYLPVACRLQVHPHLGAGAEVPGQAQRPIGGDAAGAVHDGSEAVRRHTRH